MSLCAKASGPDIDLVNGVLPPSLCLSTSQDPALAWGGAASYFRHLIFFCFSLSMFPYQGREWCLQH